MLDPKQIRRAVEMQHRSYLLLKWMASAVRDGFINFETAHAYSTLPEAAESWILGHYFNIPSNARPAQEGLGAFSEFFSTYLTNSFDLIANPGKQLYSPHDHCFCPMCSWLADAPNLKAKKVTSADKRRAEKMRIGTLLQVALENQITITESEITEVLEGNEHVERASLVAYGYDLLQRMKGIANGPAVLSLWRGFAWTKAGSPKSGFRLTADLIIDAERRMIEVMKDIAQVNHGRTNG